MRRILALTLLTLAAPPPQAAAADDSLVATVARPTTIDAAGGRAVWSAWDPAARVYRLTEFANGATRAVPVRPSRVPFDVDLAPGGGIAVYSRCARPPLSTWELNGRRGCDVHRFDFGSGRESRVGRINSDADEYWPTITRRRIAFTRTYRSGHRVLYWRSLTGSGPSRRLRGGPTFDETVPEELDLRDGRVTFMRNFEYGAEVRLATTDGRGRVLVGVPGSGAAAREFSAYGPTLAGGFVHWTLSSIGSNEAPSELRRHALSSGRNTRATALVDGMTTGFARAGARAWYVRSAPGGYEVRAATGLTYEPAPPIDID
jgi:hypothetical protein